MGVGRDVIGSNIFTGDIKIEALVTTKHAEQALTIFEQIEDPNGAKVRAQLDAWREQTNT